MEKILMPIFAGIGGLALFVLGMQIMGDGLQKVAGDRLREVLRKMTSKPVYGVGVGAFITAIIQSSSATTVMLVGFVNAGLLTLPHAVGVVFGANIGTTITAQIVSFKFLAWAIWPSIFFGVGLRMFGQRKYIRFIGEVLLGFGILFLGMEFMKDVFSGLKQNQAAIDFLQHIAGNAWMGLLTGAVFTALIQSSSATSGIVIGLVGTGMIDLPAGIAIIIGANIGTCITALLASIGAPHVGARKVAMAHILFNVIGALIFINLIGPTSALVAKTSILPARQVANYHTFFNVTMTVAILPFTALFVKLVNRLVPGKEPVFDVGVRYISDPILTTPSLALAQVTEELVRMLDIARHMVLDAKSMLVEGSKKYMAGIMTNEKTVNTLQTKITAYISKLTQKSLSDQQAERSISLLHIVHDVERIGDHATNIAELTEDYIDKRVKFTDEGMADLEQLFDLTDKACVIVGEALSTYNESLIPDMKKLEDEIDRRTVEVRDKHFENIKNELCKPESGIYYLDIASNLERVGDHCMNIAHSVHGIKKEDEEKHDKPTKHVIRD